MTIRKTAIIIGAGPAGLTAAYELLTRTDIRPVVLEKSTSMGGISRTVEHHGNRIDIGGHRFFSKSDRVMAWWLRMLPMQAPAGTAPESGRGEPPARMPAAGPQRPEAGSLDRAMLLRPRRSRIFYRRMFFDYPIRLTASTLRNLGFWRMLRIGFSYLRSIAFPIRPETSLEDFLVNRFGRELYRTFFMSYTEKVWGVPCQQISAAWGAQRIKGLSILGALRHALTPARKAGISQKDTETSLIEQFLYPRLGPGQMWETTADEIRRLGGEILISHEVTGLRVRGGRVLEAEAMDKTTGGTIVCGGDYFFSSMPVKELVRGLDGPIPPAMHETSEGLLYRDFITVGLLVSQFKLKEKDGTLIKDNWMYIQEEDVKVGRLQVFNNWSPFMVADPRTVWVGAEYFCAETDAIWQLSDDAMAQFAARELEAIGIIDRAMVLDHTVIRVPKAYPTYFGTYAQFGHLREWLDQFENLFLIGRNGMHRYNNQDHSMLTAMTAVDNIIAGRRDRANIWSTNTEDEYHEDDR